MNLLILILILILILVPDTLGSCAIPPFAALRTGVHGADIRAHSLTPVLSESASEGRDF